MKIEDITKFELKEGILKNLKAQETTLLDLAFRIRYSKPRDEKHLCLHNLLVYTSTQLKYLQQSIDYPTEFYAWIARNLFELNLLVRYVLKSHKYLKEFTSQLANDEKQMLEGMKKIVPANQTDVLNDISERICQLENIAAKHQVTLKSQRVIKDLAEIAEMTDEYEAFFKLYSKYVHPSSWLIFGIEQRVHSGEIRNTFLVQAQLYAGYIAKIVSDNSGITV